MTMTLTVDASAKPIGLITVEDAVAKVAAATIKGCDRVQALIVDENIRYRSQHLDLPCPVVIMWQDYIELESKETSRVSRRVMYARDHYQCQYCGWIAEGRSAYKNLSLDHVKPAHLFPNREAATTWDNVTTACIPCNIKKAGHLPREVGMMPKSLPKEPHYVQLRFAGRLNPEQRDYVRAYYKDRVFF